MTKLQDSYLPLNQNPLRVRSLTNWRTEEVLRWQTKLRTNHKAHRAQKNRHKGEYVDHFWGHNLTDVACTLDVP
jgi:hypothetical protein